jgi:hypothetical protein
MKTKKLLVITAIAIISFSMMGLTVNKQDKKTMPMEYTYEVLPCTQAMIIDGNWDKPVWNETKSVKLENYMGKRPEHFPAVEMKMRYDKNNIYVIFKVDDRYVKAVATETNGRVWEDSCVEFFFTPGSDTQSGYFNLETNCIGTFLMQYHNRIANDDGFVRSKDNKDIEIKSSIDFSVKEEYTEPLTWYLEYRMPVSFLKNYLPFEQPAPGVKWRANFYKCGDKTSHPHWLTWAPVDFPEPKFHLPEFFGTIEFQ